MGESGSISDGYHTFDELYPKPRERPRLLGGGVNRECVIR